MVILSQVRLLNSQLVHSHPLVAVFTGGTSGIGEYTIRTLATTHADDGDGLRVYLIGRNADAAEKILHDCRIACPSGKFVFVKANDLSLLKDVDTACDRVIEMEKKEVGVEGTAKIDILVMSQACTVFQTPKRTEEGLDFLMSLMYYSRLRTVMKLLPLLIASPKPASVVSIYAAGMEGKLDVDDLGLRKQPNYSYFQARSHINYMKTLFMERLTLQHSGKISFVHVFPGLVITPAYQDPTIPGWFKFLWSWLEPVIARVYAIPAEECGARMLSLTSSQYPPHGTNTAGSDNRESLPIGTDGSVGSGTYVINWNGEPISVLKSYQKIDKGTVSDRVWQHTMGAFEKIQSGQVFED